MASSNGPKTKLNLKLSSSPTLSISDPDAILHLTVAVSIANTDDEHKDKPLTLSIEDSVLGETAPGEPGIDVFGRRQGGFTSLLSASSDRSKHISLGQCMINGVTKGHSNDLRDLGHRFLTVPAATSPSEQGQEGQTSRVATITHKLDWDRIFRYEEKRSKTDLIPGEVFKINMTKRFMGGPRWWCWCDVEGDLKGKKLYVWAKGFFSEEKPEVDDSWVLGEDRTEVEFEDVTPGGEASFTVVE